MATVIIPFRSGGKTRLPVEIRALLSVAMLEDVLEAAVACATSVRLVTGDALAVRLAAEVGVEAVADPGGGQGAAVAAALAGLRGPCLVVNADLPCISTSALSQLAARDTALVAAADGTTNALSLSEAQQFRPLYGPGSAARFTAAGFAAVAIPELEHDIDTLTDLQGAPLPFGARTARVVDHHRLRLETNA